MMREKIKIAATRHAKHEWSLKRKALAVTLSIALLGLGTPAVSFADSAADQKSKAVETQAATSAVYAQEQTPASAAPVSKENASSAVSKDEAPAPASSDDQPSDKASVSTESAGTTVSEVDASVGESASNAAEADNEGSIEHTINVGQPEISGEASVVVGFTTKFTACNFDNPEEVKWDSDNTDVATVDANGVVTGVGVGKANISAYSGNQSASRQIEVKRDESGNGYYVYLYTKAEGDTTGLALTVNKDGWYTIGRVWVKGITTPAKGSTEYATSGDNYDKVMDALKDPSNVDLYGVNSINLEDINWSYPDQDTGLKTAQGAADYDTSANRTWHLDGYVNFNKVGFGSVEFHYKDVDTDKEISQYKAITAKVTGDKFDFSNYIISIYGYTYDHPDPSEVVVERGAIKRVTLYYKRGTFHYTVYYKEKGTEKELASPETTTVSYGSTVKEDARDIRGYTVVGNSSQSLKIDAQNKSITFHYAAKQGKVGYYLADSSAKWTAPADMVDAGGMKWYYNYGFAKGDTVKVIKSEPTAAGKAFIGWLDKERGDQPAAIRKAGDTVTCIYDGAKTYTLDALWASLDVTGYKDTYDGKEHGLASVNVAINKGSDLAQQYQDQAKNFIKQGAVQYSTDDGKTWSDVAPKYKDAGTYPVKVKVDVTAGGHIATLEATANIVIEPAALEVTTPSASRAYDGQPLTAKGSVEGFVNGETAVLNTTGSQTAVGWSDNTYDIEWTGTAKESNYKVSEDLGILEVTAAPDSPTPDDQSKDQGIFNGNGAGLVQTGDMTGLYGTAAIIAAVVAAFVSLLVVRRRKK